MIIRSLSHGATNICTYRYGLTYAKHIRDTCCHAYSIYLIFYEFELCSLEIPSHVRLEPWDDHVQQTAAVTGPVNAQCELSSNHCS